MLPIRPSRISTVAAFRSAARTMPRRIAELWPASEIGMSTPIRAHRADGVEAIGWPSASASPP
ncbi:MAG: hypothetical protein ACK5RL_03800, partial [Acidimicrobiales bacterium]